MHLKKKHNDSLCRPASMYRISPLHSSIIQANLLPSDFQCFKLIIDSFEFSGDWTRNGYWDEWMEKKTNRRIDFKMHIRFTLFTLHISMNMYVDPIPIESNPDPIMALIFFSLLLFWNVIKDNVAINTLTK